MAEQAAARVVLYRDAAELAAVNAGHSVMRRQALVDERVIGVQQVHYITILAHDALKQQLGLAAEGLAQVLVERGRQRALIFQLPQIEPLVGEVGGQRFRARVRQHAPRLAFQHRGLMQLVLNRKIQKFVVRDAAPKEKRKARREFQIADSIDGASGNIAGSRSKRKTNRGSMSTRAKACSMPASKLASRRPDR